MFFTDSIDFSVNTGHFFSSSFLHSKPQKVHTNDLFSEWLKGNFEFDIFQDRGWQLLKIIVYGFEAKEWSAMIFLRKTTK